MTIPPELWAELKREDARAREGKLTGLIVTRIHYHEGRPTRGSVVPDFQIAIEQAAPDYSPKG